jgi:hypothetical protein
MVGVPHLIEDDLDLLEHALDLTLAQEAQEFLAPYAAFDAWLQEHGR